MAGLASVWLGEMVLTFLAWNGGDGQRNHGKTPIPVLSAWDFDDHFGREFE